MDEEMHYRNRYPVVGGKEVMLHRGMHRRIITVEQKRSEVLLCGRG